MQLLSTLTAAALLAPLGSLAAPAGDGTSVPQFQSLSTRENLCSLQKPPQLCTPDPSVTVEETARRAYQFYRAFVVDGDPRTMFSLIDNVYLVSFSPFSFGVQGLPTPWIYLLLETTRD